jgi:hypothetical protein
VADVRARQNPVDRSQRSITNFTPALRCMDEWMFKAGTRDVTMMMEEMRDATQKVPVSARDMMTSAISDMTRRSRAVRLSVFGSDQGNLAQLLQQAQKTQAFSVIPEFNLRGTSASSMRTCSARPPASAWAERAFGVRLSNGHASGAGLTRRWCAPTTSRWCPAPAARNHRKAQCRRGRRAGLPLGAGAVFSTRRRGQCPGGRNMSSWPSSNCRQADPRTVLAVLGLPDDQQVACELEDWFFSMDEAERIALGSHARASCSTARSTARPARVRPGRLPARWACR